jgi:hypothetical protein
MPCKRRNALQRALQKRIDEQAEEERFHNIAFGNLFGRNWCVQIIVTFNQRIDHMIPVYRIHVSTQNINK